MPRLCFLREAPLEKKPSLWCACVRARFCLSAATAGGAAAGFGAKQIRNVVHGAHARGLRRQITGIGSLPAELRCLYPEVNFLYSTFCGMKQAISCETGTKRLPCVVIFFILTPIDPLTSSRAVHSPMPCRRPLRKHAAAGSQDWGPGLVGFVPRRESGFGVVVAFAPRDPS